MRARNVKQNETTLFSQKQYTPFTEGGVSPKRSTRGVFERFLPCFRAKKKHRDDDDDDERASQTEKPLRSSKRLSARLENFSLEKNTAETQEAVSAEKTKKKHMQRYLAEEQRTHVDTLLTRHLKYAFT